MTDRFLVLGAGPVGRAVARDLLDRGGQVTLASRSGRGRVEGAESRTLDAKDVGAVTAAAQGARALFNCLNPPDYHLWPEQWPPLAHAALTAAERTGAVLATASNLYPYAGAPAPFTTDSPITAATPENPAGPKGRIRAEMWHRARAAIAAGRVHAVEVRSGTYLGDGSLSTLVAAIGPALEGRGAWVLARADQPHTFTFVPDVARTLVAAALDSNAWDRMWLTPSPSPKTQAQVLSDLAHAAHQPRARVHTIPEPMLRALGPLWPMAREQRELDGYRRRPFVMDGSETSHKLGIEPTPWIDIVGNVAASTG